MHLPDMHMCGAFGVHMWVCGEFVCVQVCVYGAFVSVQVCMWGAFVCVVHMGTGRGRKGETEMKLLILE